MTYRPLLARVCAVSAVTAVAALLGAGVASAHVTAQPGTAVKGSTSEIAPGQFQEFDILASTVPDNTDQLVMPAAQTYDNGKVVQWDEQPAAPGAAEPEHPAPTVKLLAGSSEDGQNAATPAATGQDT